MGFELAPLQNCTKCRRTVREIKKETVRKCHLYWHATAVTKCAVKRCTESSLLAGTLFKVLEMFADKNKVAVLGTGRFAVVECFRPTDNNALVAVKRFQNVSNGKESKILHQLKDSHHIVQLACQYSELEPTFLAMEPLFGGSLHKHIQQGTGEMHISVVLGYICALLSALSTLEKHGCIHRDIKASNCVLNHEGRLKLCDFGSAAMGAYCLPKPRRFVGTPNALETDHKKSNQHRAMTITGTPHIMAPEMVASDVGYDYSVDYWAVGVLLYELLTGHIPQWKRAAINASNSLQNAEEPTVAWPHEHARDISQLALTISSNADACVTRAPETAEIIQSSPEQAVPTIPYSPEVTEEMRNSWNIEAVDASFFETPVATTTRYGEYTVTQSPEEIAQRNHAVDLVRVLLTVDPYSRHSRLAAYNTAALDSTENTENLWSEVIRYHPLFNGVDWGSIDNGTAGPANPDFDKRLGCMELLERFNGSSDVIAEADQDLFAGF